MLHVTILIRPFFQLPALSLPFDTVCASELMFALQLCIRPVSKPRAFVHFVMQVKTHSV